jgi:hypothetical protein
MPRKHLPLRLHLVDNTLIHFSIFTCYKEPPASLHLNAKLMTAKYVMSNIPSACGEPSHQSRKPFTICNVWRVLQYDNLDRWQFSQQSCDLKHKLTSWSKETLGMLLKYTYILAWESSRHNHRVAQLMYMFHRQCTHIIMYGLGSGYESTFLQFSQY